MGKCYTLRAFSDLCRLRRSPANVQCLTQRLDTLKPNLTVMMTKYVSLDKAFVGRVISYWEKETGRPMPWEDKLSLSLASLPRSDVRELATAMDNGEPIKDSLKERLDYWANMNL